MPRTSTNPKSTHLRFAVLCIVTLATPAANGAGLTIVHDQSRLTASNGKASQKFESNCAAVDSEGGDDFTVGGTGSVVIREVHVQGRCSAAGVAASTVLVRILAGSAAPGDRATSAA